MHARLVIFVKIFELLLFADHSDKVFGDASSFMMVRVVMVVILRYWLHVSVLQRRTLSGVMDDVMSFKQCWTVYF